MQLIWISPIVLLSALLAPNAAWLITGFGVAANMLMLFFYS